MLVRKGSEGEAERLHYRSRREYSWGESGEREDRTGQLSRVSRAYAHCHESKLFPSSVSRAKLVDFMLDVWKERERSLFPTPTTSPRGCIHAW